MKKSFAKKIGSNKKGFTLAELLIVVAIVAVLVAISIPVFTSKLEKAREATDVANMRAAKAAAVAKYLDTDASAETTGTFYYDADNGKLLDDPADAKSLVPYGKGTDSDGDITYEGYDNADKTDDIIKVEISDGTDDKDEGTVTVSWIDPTTL